MSTDEHEHYLDYHAQRFDYVRTLLRDLFAPGGAILEVGVSPFVPLLRREFTDVTTLGLPLGVETLYGGPHIPFNLVTTDVAALPTGRRFDVIIFGEVIEHLYQAPEVSLRFLRRLIKPEGRMILQTPNAAALVKRIALARGQHPYDLLRTDPDNPGHVREFTRDELVTALGASGFEVERHIYASYFKRPPVTGLSAGQRLVRVLESVVPAFRDGQTVVARPA